MKVVTKCHVSNPIHLDSVGLVAFDVTGVELGDRHFTEELNQGCEAYLNPRGRVSLLPVLNIGAPRNEFPRSRGKVPGSFNPVAGPNQLNLMFL
jgi:hypothetical protein